MSALVSQISPPIRILLIGAVVFMAAWFTVLKPKEAEIPAAVPAPAGPQSAAGEAAAKARAGAATAEADAARAADADAEQGGSASAPNATSPTQSGSARRTDSTTAAAPALPALAPESLEGLPTALRTGLEERKVLVLGVLNTEARPWAPMADDDRAVRNALRDVNRYDGGVVVRIAPLGRLARYDGLLKALQVTQSPTVVVVDRNRRAVALEGYVDRPSINQAIADARDTSVARRIKDPYLREVNVFCGRWKLNWSRASLPTVRGGGGRTSARWARIATDNRRAFVSIAAPKRWRTLKGQTRRVLDREVRATRTLRGAMRSGDTAAARSVFTRAGTPTAADVALDRRFNRVGLTGCAATRTR